MPVLMTKATTTTSAAARDIFTERCSAWSCAPWVSGARHAVVTIQQFINATKHGGKMPSNIIMARDLLASAWDEQSRAEAAPTIEEEEKFVLYRNNLLNGYKWAKEQSACAILQGVNPDRKADTFESLARVLCIDIDATKPGEAPNGNEWVTDWNQVKKDLGALPWVAYAGISAGGCGVFLLIPIALDDAQSYAEYYNAWAYLLRKNFNLVTDPSCKNRNRLRYMTWEPDPVINHAALVWDKFLQAPQDWRGTAQLATPCSLDTEQKNMVREAVEYCTRNGVNMAESYDEWLHLAAFFAHCWDDPEGAGLFHALAAQSPKYRTGENERKLRNLARMHPNPVKIGTFVKMCKDNGVPVRGCSAPAASFKPWPGNAATVTPPSSPQEPPRPLQPCSAPFGAAPTTERPYWEPCDPAAIRETMQTEARKLEGHTFPFKDCHRLGEDQATMTPPPVMSESEAEMLNIAGDYIAEGQGIVERMRAENPQLDDLCRDLDLEYCGHMNQEGRGWVMSSAQFSAYYDQQKPL